MLFIFLFLRGYQLSVIFLSVKRKHSQPLLVGPFSKKGPTLFSSGFSDHFLVVKVRQLFVVFSCFFSSEGVTGVKFYLGDIFLIFFFVIG